MKLSTVNSSLVLSWVVVGGWLILVVSIIKSVELSNIEAAVVVEVVVELSAVSGSAVATVISVDDIGTSVEVLELEPPDMLVEVCEVEAVSVVPCLLSNNGSPRVLLLLIRSLIVLQDL